MTQFKVVHQFEEILRFTQDDRVVGSRMRILSPCKYPLVSAVLEGERIRNSYPPDPSFRANARNPFKLMHYRKKDEDWNSGFLIADFIFKLSLRF